jgi:hypothetical protein
MRKKPPVMSWDEAVQRENVDQLNRHLMGKGFVLFKNPSSITVMSESGGLLFRSRSVKGAVERIQRMLQEQ